MRGISSQGKGYRLSRHPPLSFARVKLLEFRCRILSKLPAHGHIKTKCIGNGTGKYPQFLKRKGDTIFYGLGDSDWFLRKQLGILKPAGTRSLSGFSSVIRRFKRLLECYFFFVSKLFSKKPGWTLFTVRQVFSLLKRGRFSKACAKILRLKIRGNSDTRVHNYHNSNYRIPLVSLNDSSGSMEFWATHRLLHPEQLCQVLDLT